MRADGPRVIGLLGGMSAADSTVRVLPTTRLPVEAAVERALAP